MEIKKIIFIVLVAFITSENLFAAGFNLNIVNKSTKTIWVQSQKDTRVGYNYIPGSLIPVNSNMTQTLSSEVSSVPYYFFYSNVSNAPSMAQITFDASGFTANSNPLGFPIKTNYLYQFDNTQLTQKPSDFTIYVTDPTCNYNASAPAWDYSVDSNGNASNFKCVAQENSITAGHFNFQNNTNQDAISITGFNPGFGSCTPGLPTGIAHGNSASFDAWCTINSAGSIQYTPIGGSAQTISLKNINTTDTYFQITFNQSSVTLNSGTTSGSYPNAIGTFTYVSPTATASVTTTLPAVTTPTPTPVATTPSINSISVGHFNFTNNTKQDVISINAFNTGGSCPGLGLPTGIQHGNSADLDIWCAINANGSIQYTPTGGSVQTISLKNINTTDTYFQVTFSQTGVTLNSGKSSGSYPNAIGTFTYISPTPTVTPAVTAPVTPAVTPTPTATPIVTPTAIPAATPVAPTPAVIPTVTPTVAPASVPAVSPAAPTPTPTVTQTVTPVTTPAVSPAVIAITQAAAPAVTTSSSTTIKAPVDVPTQSIVSTTTSSQVADSEPIIFLTPTLTEEPVVNTPSNNSTSVGHFNFTNNTKQDVISINAFNTGGSCPGLGLPTGIQHGNSADLDVWCKINANGFIQYTLTSASVQTISLKNINSIDTYFQVIFNQTGATLSSGTSAGSYPNAIGTFTYVSPNAAANSSNVVPIPTINTTLIPAVTATAASGILTPTVSSATLSPVITTSPTTVSNVSSALPTLLSESTTAIPVTSNDSATSVLGVSTPIVPSVASVPLASTLVPAPLTPASTPKAALTSVTPIKKATVVAKPSVVSKKPIVPAKPVAKKPLVSKKPVPVLKKPVVAKKPIVVARPVIKVTNSDGCKLSGQSCKCSNTGLSGTCSIGDAKPGLYCHCDEEEDDY
ncbi:MAG: hypothetical protein P4L22_01845 [Candidatus Babeliales bacterium]|nr:hypothetical protein [Candidatus Babeliales bacterium]